MTGPDKHGEVVSEARNLADVRGIGRNVTLIAYQATGPGVKDHDALKQEIVIGEVLAPVRKHARRGFGIPQLGREVLGNFARENYSCRDRQVRGLRPQSGGVPAQVPPGARLGQPQFVRVRAKGIDGKISMVNAVTSGGASGHEKAGQAAQKPL
jgi:hypothetical protein